MNSLFKRVASPIRLGSKDVRGLFVVVVLLAVLPLFLSGFGLTIATVALMFALMGTGWNMMGGYAGQFSFGHAAYFGIGAYSVAVLLTKYLLSPWVGLLIGGLLAALFGLLTGFLSFRYKLRGPSFALATFAFAEMLRLLASSSSFINKSIGIHIPLVGGDDWARIQFEDTRRNSYFVILFLLVLALATTVWMVRARVGHYMVAIRDDEDAAAALGVNPLRYKLIAVALSGFFTALAGGFYVQYFLFIDPDLAFGALVSIQILLRPIVGGVGTIWGPLVGAGVLSLLGEWTRALVRQPPAFLGFLQGVNGLDGMLFGAILIAVIIFAPDGVVGVVRRIRARAHR